MTRTSTPRRAPRPGRRARPSTSRTSHPASASAAASERPALPGPISRTVVTGHLSALQPLTEGAGRSRRSDQYAASVPTTSTSPPARFSAPRRDEIGGQLGQRLDHEAPLPHAGMGDDQVVFVDHQVPHEQDVHVQGAGPEAHRARRGRRRPRAAGPRRAAGGARGRCRARPRGSDSGSWPAGPPTGSVSYSGDTATTSGRPATARPQVRPPVAQVGAEAEKGPHRPSRPSAGRGRRRTATVRRRTGRRGRRVTGGRSLRTATVTASTAAVRRARRSAMAPARDSSRSCGRPGDDRHGGLDGGAVVGGVGQVVARPPPARCRGTGRGRSRRAGAAPLLVEHAVHAVDAQSPHLDAVLSPAMPARARRQVAPATPSSDARATMSQARGPIWWPMRRSTTAMAWGPPGRRPLHNR